MNANEYINGDLPSTGKASEAPQTEITFEEGDPLTGYLWGNNGACREFDEVSEK